MRKETLYHFTIRSSSPLWSSLFFSFIRMRCRTTKRIPQLLLQPPNYLPLPVFSPNYSSASPGVRRMSSGPPQSPSRNSSNLYLSPMRQRPNTPGNASSKFSYNFGESPAKVFCDQIDFIELPMFLYDLGSARYK